MSNIYKITSTHYSPKDSHSSIMGFVLANNDEQVFNWIMSDPTIHDLNISSFDVDEIQENNDGYGYDVTDEKFNVIKHFTTYKEYLIHVGGSDKSDYESYEDLFYGRTFYGWSLFKQNIEQNLDEDFLNGSIDLGLITDITNI